jgi:hypothetical protein
MGKPVKKFLPTSADYDARIFSFREKDWSVSLTLVGGRERFLVDVGSYQKGKLSGFTPTSATLVKHQNGTYSANIQVKSTGRPRLMTQEIVEKLETELQDPEGFESYQEVQKWLSSCYDLQVSYPTVHQWVRYRLQGKLKVPRPVSIKQKEGN